MQYIRYTSEYISKLQIHQHSLLTRKVFFRHNFQYYSSSLYQLDLLIICISKSSLYSCHLYLDLDHHYWIILNLKHHWIILDLEHHWIILDLEHL